MRKGEKFVWNEEREKSFEELKQRLVSAPVLTLPSGSGGFWIYSDASKKGLGCVLMQHGKSEHETKALDYPVSRLAEIFQQEIVRLQGSPSAIVGERVIEGLEMIEATNAKVAVAKEKLKEARTHRQERVMRKKTIPFVKILWRNHSERDATWETEESIRTSYPHFLP
nr:putative reverse transcriptase domain-containing protein [Tanacetum cinerariifolium]